MPQSRVEIPKWPGSGIALLGTDSIREESHLAFPSSLYCWCEDVLTLDDDASGEQRWPLETRLFRGV